MIESLALFIGAAGPAAAGWRFFAASLDDGRDAVAQTLFSASFALSAGLLELLVAEVAGVLAPATRAAAFRADVWGLLALLLVALPYTTLYRVLASRREGEERGPVGWKATEEMASNRPVSPPQRRRRPRPPRSAHRPASPPPSPPFGA